MTPTQAQVNAAGGVLYEKFCKGAFMPYVCHDMARAALIAAAEVGENADDKFWKRELERVELRHRIELVATIERCAQVAEEHHLSHSGETLAAAIRALKDKL